MNEIVSASDIASGDVIVSASGPCIVTKVFDNGDEIQFHLRDSKTNAPMSWEGSPRALMARQTSAE